jgi:hypothetical protein
MSISGDNERRNASVISVTELLVDKYFVCARQFERILIVSEMCDVSVTHCPGISRDGA